MRVCGLAVFLALTSLLILCIFPTQAQVGVGVSLGRISVDEPLSPGGTYRLPSVSVMNTGNEAGDYEVEVTYLHEQQELRPPADWITFDPKSFTLKPGEARAVSITLNIPARAKPGDYFAFIEAHPVSKAEGVTIAIAAATKLYFTVKPSNIFVAILTKISNFFQRTAPTSYILPGLFVLAIAIFFLRRHIRIRIRVERK